MVEGTIVDIKQAKGRPMLSWVGKQPLRNVISYPSQLVETYVAKQDYSSDGVNWTDWPEKFNRGGLLFHGDNKDVLAHLLANGFRGKIKLIYIDPPFNTGVDYVRKVTLRQTKMEKMEAEPYSFTEQIQYSANYSVDLFLQFLYERLLLAKELLSSDGMIFIRMDVHQEAFLRLIADEVFGHENFQNTIVVNRVKKNVTNKGRRTIPHAVDMLLVYFKTKDAEFLDVLKKLPTTKPASWHGMESPGVPGPRFVIIDEKTYYPSPGRHFTFTQLQVDEMKLQGKIRINPNTDRPEYLIDERDFENLDSDWTDIPGYTFTTGYPTENSRQLLERVIRVGSKPNDIVLDFFVGSGTTVEMAQQLGRRWIGVDINKGAIQTTTKRLQSTMHKQAVKITRNKRSLPGFEDGPSQMSFSIYRVNDYDLQIQHNEAFNLAVEHLGMTRTKTDIFFDGTLGKRLVKIIPFTHPCTVMDLEEVKIELGNRPDEGRDIAVVCLGKELAVDKWLEDWNRMRKRGDFPNKIEVIELRTDPRYGGFFIHEPAQASIQMNCVGQSVQIIIKDFISPTILKRLDQQSEGSLLRPQITDWRSMVDSVMIDNNYNGMVFNIILSDIPEKNDDLVIGNYEVPVTEGCTIAVKITDMLGEEVLSIFKI